MLCTISEHVQKCYLKEIVLKKIFPRNVKLAVYNFIFCVNLELFFVFLNLLIRSI